jgi:hypothetical protein
MSLREMGYSQVRLEKKSLQVPEPIPKRLLNKMPHFAKLLMENLFA